MRNDVAHVGDDTCKQCTDNADGTDYKELPALLINRIGLSADILDAQDANTQQTRASPRRFTETKYSLSRISPEWHVRAVRLS